MLVHPAPGVSISPASADIALGHPDDVTAVSESGRPESGSPAEKHEKSLHCCANHTYTHTHAHMSNSSIIIPATSKNSALDQLFQQSALLYPGNLEPSATTTTTTEFVALYFSASYCPSCVAFTPSLVEAYEKRLRGRLDIVLVSCDRDRPSYDEYRMKMPFAAVPFAALQGGLKASLRDLYAVNTIPRLVVLHARTGATVLADARADVQDHGAASLLRAISSTADGNAAVELDVAQELGTTAPAPPPVGWDRALTTPMFALGHVVPGKKGTYMDEHVVRCRAGLLNIASWIALANVVVFRERVVLWVLWPVVCVEFLASCTVGLTPLAPFGVVATLLVHALGAPEPLWKPASPKRFAWALGLALVNVCFLAFHLDLKVLVVLSVVTCNVLTWLESALGFCLGCFIYNKLVAPALKMEECEDCKV